MSEQTPPYGATTLTWQVKGRTIVVQGEGGVLVAAGSPKAVSDTLKELFEAALPERS